MQYHSNIGSLNTIVMSGNDQLIIPERCKDAETNADKHPVGLRSVNSLKESVRGFRKNKY